MSRLRHFFEDNNILKLFFFIITTAIILLTSYEIITNIKSVLAFLGAAGSSLVGALSPLLIGMIIAYLVAPLVKILERKVILKIFNKISGDPIKAKKKEVLIHVCSIILTFLIIIAAVIAIIYTVAFLIVGQLVFSSFGNMIQSVSDYFNQYQNVIQDFINKMSGTPFESKVKELASAALSWFSDNINVNTVLGFVGGIAGSIFNVFLGLIVSIYILLDLEFFGKMWNKLLSISIPEGKAAGVNSTFGEVNYVIGQFLRGQLLDGLIIAILSSIALTLIGLDFAVFIGFFAGLANVIPYFGPILGMVPAVIIALLTGGWTQALLVVVVFLVIQQIDGAIISPRIVGSTTGLHPVFVLAAVTFGGYYWGILGMLLAVPITAIIKLFLVKKFGPVEQPALK